MNEYSSISSIAHYKFFFVIKNTTPKTKFCMYRKFYNLYHCSQAVDL